MLNFEQFPNYLDIFSLETYLKLIWAKNSSDIFFSFVVHARAVCLLVVYILINQTCHKASLGVFKVKITPFFQGE